MRVLLCDDHVLFCEALRASLVASGHEVEAAHVPEHAVVLATSSSFDVVVMDLGFPEGDALASIRDIVDQAPTTAVVVLTAAADSASLVTAVNAGAAAVCSKSQRLQEVVGVIERARPLSSDAGVSDVVVRLLRRRFNDERRLAEYLTPREREVLARLVEGQSTHTIAEEMGVSYSTSRTHIQNLLAKLGVHSRLEASAYAIRNNLVDELIPRQTRRSIDPGATDAGSDDPAVPPRAAQVRGGRA